MRLTTKSKYGTRLILDLAANSRNKPVPLCDIAKRQNISVKYLEHLTRKLRQAGIIKSQRGPLGGHMLAKLPSEISMGQIVRTLEGTSAITDCAEDNSKLCTVCDRSGDCLSKWVWIEASNAMFKCLDNITVAKLLKKAKFTLKD